MISYDEILASPPEPEQKYWIVETTMVITRNYTGRFFGTEDEAQDMAKEAVLANIGDFEDESMTLDCECREQEN